MKLYIHDGGQTRVIFSPIKRPNEVLKIALNTAGKFANKSEYQTFKAYDELGLGKFFAEVVDSFDRYTIIIMEKMICCNNDMNYNPEYMDNAIKLKREIDGEIKKLKLDQNTDDSKFNKLMKLMTIEDIHQNNVGHNENGEWKLVDYAV